MNINQSYHNTQPCQQLNKRNINKYCKSLPRVRKAILKEILYFNQKYIKAFPSQKLIAKKVGCSRQYVNETINEFVSAGIILKTNFNWRSCLYELYPYLYSKEFRKKSDLLLQTDIKVRQKKTTPISPLSYSLFLYSEAVVLAKCNITANEEEELKNQRKLQKKGRELMFKPQVEISEAVKKLTIKLTAEQQQDLSKYSEAQLKAAENIIKNRNNIKTPDKLLFWLLKNEPKVINAAAVSAPPEIKIIREEQPEKSFKQKMIEHKQKKIKELESILSYDPEHEMSVRHLEELKKELKSYEEQPKIVTGDTPVKIANGIVTFMDETYLNKMTALTGLNTAIKLRDVYLKNWLERKLTFTNEVGEAEALAMINKYRNIYKLPPILNENSQERVEHQETKKDSTIVKFDTNPSESNIDDFSIFEEVL